MHTILWSPMATGTRSRPSVESEILTLAEVARYLRLSKKTIYKMARRGELPAFKAGNHWRLTRHELEEWIRRRTRAGAGS